MELSLAPSDNQQYEQWRIEHLPDWAFLRPYLFPRTRVVDIDGWHSRGLPEPSCEDDVFWALRMEYKPSGWALNRMKAGQRFDLMRSYWLNPGKIHVLIVTGTINPTIPETFYRYDRRGWSACMPCSREILASELQRITASHNQRRVLQLPSAPPPTWEITSISETISQLAIPW